MLFFITGAAGFVGLTTTKYLLQYGHTVWGLCRTTSQAKMLQEAGAIPVIASLDMLADTSLPRVDVVVHCAGLVAQWAPHTLYHAVNVGGTKQAMEKAIELGAKRFIHISSDSVLMNGRDTFNLDEAAPWGTVNFPYPQSKRLAEQLLESYKGQMELVILRPRMIWGSTTSPLYRFMEAAAVSGKFLWLSQGTAITSVTHCLNLAEAIRLSAVNPAAVGHVFHLSDQQTHSLKDFWQQQLATKHLQLPNRSLPGWMARLIARMVEPLWLSVGMKKSPPISRMAAITFSRSCTLNSQKITTLLGYKEIVGFQEGLSLMAN